MKTFFPLLLVAVLVFAGCDSAIVEAPVNADVTSQEGVLRFNTTSSAKSAAGTYAIAVPYALQGTLGSGGAILVERTDPNTMLGMADGKFFSLGFDRQDTPEREGEVILDFSAGLLLNALTVTLQEITNDVNPGNPYPEEKVEVYVGTDVNGPWTMIGTGTNAGPRPTTTSVLPLGEQACVRYVRLVDVTDLSGYSSTRRRLADGFDVDAVSIESDGECSTGNCIQSKNLIAGQHNDVGDVLIERLSATQIKVTFKLDVPGSITDTYVHVGTSLSDFPLNPKGQPKSGQFEYKTEGHAAGTTEFSYLIDLTPAEAASETLLIGAHANVRYQWNGRWLSDTAWGEGPRFTGRNWFMYMLFDCD